jgi:hypothetical protein
LNICGWLWGKCEHQFYQAGATPEGPPVFSDDIPEEFLLLFGRQDPLPKVRMQARMAPSFASSGRPFLIERRELLLPVLRESEVGPSTAVTLAWICLYR